MTRLTHTERWTAYTDEVTDPAGRPGTYEWVDTPDLVRVATVTPDDEVHLVYQYEYLPRRGMWQLPGGAVAAGEDPATAAARALAIQAGVIAGRWRSYGAVWPMPGLTPARVHLFSAEDLADDPEGTPRDPATQPVPVPMPMEQAVTAALDNSIGCAASAQLVLALAATRRSDPAT
ncbi:NUDIX domain-containing protein [Krasilnikovia sp. MM14-A1259]|uniref:NUDIX domain-containing protein n=1 Tax=Krasilnikovia sp. MM14-A1259 TaxID=3373539 RepID=UPI00381E1405